MLIWWVVLKSRWCRIGYYRLVSKLSSWFSTMSLLCETAEVLTVCLSSGDGIWLCLWPRGLMVCFHVQHLGLRYSLQCHRPCCCCCCGVWTGNLLISSRWLIGNRYLSIFSFVANYEEQKPLQSFSTLLFLFLSVVIHLHWHFSALAACRATFKHDCKVRTEPFPVLFNSLTESSHTNEITNVPRYTGNRRGNIVQKQFE